MKYLLTIVVCFLIFVCSDHTDTPAVLPPALMKILSHHGTHSRWDKMEALSFQVKKNDGKETHFIDLKSRRGRIEGPTYKLGYDGKDIWVSADSIYEGNPDMYHNLYFYLFAMPFVLSDDGIEYEQAPPILFNGQQYPGLKISFKKGIGNSPNDEYFLHYDPRTYRMAWLGHTFTYFEKEKSPHINWIRYDDWQWNNKILLPKSITCYNAINGEITGPSNNISFDSISINAYIPYQYNFEKPKRALVIK
ncbi:MAG: DUF6503 family protein [Bacteroidota bacterium]